MVSLSVSLSASLESWCATNLSTQFEQDEAEAEFFHLVSSYSGLPKLRDSGHQCASPSQMISTGTNIVRMTNVSNITATTWEQPSTVPPAFAATTTIMKLNWFKTMTLDMNSPLKAIIMIKPAQVMIEPNMPTNAAMDFGTQVTYLSWPCPAKQLHAWYIPFAEIPGCDSSQSNHNPNLTQCRC